MKKIKSTLKNFFSTMGGYLMLALSAVIGVLTYAFIRKQEELEAAKAKLQLANTQKEVDLLEVEIKQKMKNRELTKKELDELQKALDLLADKRKNLTDTKTDQEIEEYWKNK